MLNFLRKLFGGSKQDRDLKTYLPIVKDINRFYQEYQAISDDALRGKTLDFRQRIRQHLDGIDQDIVNVNDQATSTEDFAQKDVLFKQVDTLKKERDKHLEDILRVLLPEAFAVVKETARRLTQKQQLVVTATDHDRDLVAKGKTYVRLEGDNAIWSNSWKAAGGDVTWNMIHYDVQLIGGMALHDGKIAEMATGEGKTLVSTLPSYLNGLSGDGVHIVTVNDYLARRDAEWNAPLYEFLLLTVDCIDRYQPNTEARRKAYMADIIYGTNNEFGFDYLRDNMAHDLDELVQKKHHFAVVDEVDSVLIDDARTPLIISGPLSVGQEEQEYMALKPEVEKLLAEQRKLATSFVVQAKKAFAEGKKGTDEGTAGLLLLRAHRALPKYRPLIKFMGEEGVKVEMQKAENHFMQEQSKYMRIADEPLLFTIDEKNRGVELTERGAEFLAKGHGDRDFFILPDITTRMMEINADSTLTIEEKSAKKEQIAQDFSIKSQRLHSIHQLLKAYTLFEKDEEYVVMEGEVKIVDEQTGRMMEGRRYSDGLHQALEAKENVKVGDITQTYATITLQNYFRMYHKLAGMTGTAETEAQELWQIYKLDVVTIPTNRKITRKDDEDLVYKTAREKYNAVIDEVSKLSAAGRPILVGTTTVEISQLLSRMLQLRGIKHNVLNAKQHQREAEIIAEAGQSGAVTIATNMAGRGTDIKLGAGVKEAGGLAIVGTERHESRRVDRQLRGRAGRQGDPGTSQFFVSLEDQLMRLFQSERIASLMDRMGHTEGEMIQHSMVTKSIERAQKKVEENNFGTRKRLLDYDDVMNIQRAAIYKKRFNALSGERLSIDLNQMFNTMTEMIAADAKMNGKYNDFLMSSWEYLGMNPEISEEEFNASSVDGVITKFQQQFQAFYDHKFEKVKELLLPICQQVFANEGHRYKRISIPYSDGRARALNIAADLQKAVQSDGDSIVKDIEQAVTLAIIDDEWKEHLRNMDELKESVQGASFEQKDPLVIYKVEAYNLFETLIQKVNMRVTSYLSKGMLLIEAPDAMHEAPPQQSDYERIQEAERQAAAEAQKAARAAQRREQLQREREEQQRAAQTFQKPQTIMRNDPKVGRNDPCPCGSGRKYKNCHGS
jgi:preprotein translocase subunit SecA